MGTGRRARRLVHQGCVNPRTSPVTQGSHHGRRTPHHRTHRTVAPLRRRTHLPVHRFVIVSCGGLTTLSPTAPSAAFSQTMRRHVVACGTGAVAGSCPSARRLRRSAGVVGSIRLRRVAVLGGPLSVPGVRLHALAGRRDRSDVDVGWPAARADGAAVLGGRRTGPRGHRPADRSVENQLPAAPDGSRQLPSARRQPRTRQRNPVLADNRLLGSDQGSDLRSDPGSDLVRSWTDDAASASSQPDEAARSASPRSAGCGVVAAGVEAPPDAPLIADVRDRAVQIEEHRVDAHGVAGLARARVEHARRSSRT